ncbi:MAG: NifB/NifX family molybdenum-iron cluster-binding protein [Pirellulales bacterium]|nr:NifB/NifX family molybdenum-iron cluster-binding protein [Pirellulales bacterium]
MKIAIPTFGTRVSPRFDCAQAVLIITVDDGEPSGREQQVASSWAPHERINRLLDLGVTVVVCGGIDCWSVESLQSAGVTVYGWVTGEIEDALTALLDGDLDFQATMQGGGRCRCRRFPADGGVSRPMAGPGHRAGRRGGQGGQGGRHGGRGRDERGGAGSGRLGNG